MRHDDDFQLFELRRFLVRVFNLPFLLAMMLMLSAFGRLNLWLPLCLGEACQGMQSGPGLLPLACSLVCITLLSFERTPMSWQESHWAYHRRTLVIGALAASALMASMLLSGAVPVQHLTGITMNVPSPSPIFLSGLAVLTTWLLARCIVSAHAASACRPVLNARSFFW
jgi:hypothetical protein